MENFCRETNPTKCEGLEHKDKIKCGEREIHCYDVDWLELIWIVSGLLSNAESLWSNATKFCRFVVKEKRKRELEFCTILKFSTRLYKQERSNMTTNLIEIGP